MLSIKELGVQYNALQMEMGASESPNWLENIDLLFSEKFTKRVNGKFLVTTRSELENQIIKCREDIGSWKIQEKEIIPSKDNQTCTIQYVISTEKAGDFEVIALLKSSNAKQIDSIDEIYYQVI